MDKKPDKGILFHNLIQEIGDEIGLRGNFLIDWGTDDIIKAYRTLHDELHPPPEMETKEVTVWASVDSTNGRVWSMGTKEQMEISVSPAPSNLIKIVELTGTYQRPVKKVKRREEISRPREFMGPIQDHQSFPNNAKFYAEWEE